MRPSSRSVFKTFCQVAIDDCFRRKRNLPIFERCFEEIANIESRFFSDFARYHDLKFSLYSY